MDGLFSNFDQDKEKINEELILSYYPMELEVDEKTFDFLASQTIKIHNTANKMHSDLGKIFFETREKLSNNKNGIFEKWYIGLGFKRPSVYRLITRYNYILSNWENKIKIESLPISLSYEISHPECSEELRIKVLEGDIKSLKEFKEFKEFKLLENKKEKPRTTEIIDLNFFNESYENIRDLSNKKFTSLSDKKKEKLKKLIVEIEKILI